MPYVNLQPDGTVERGFYRKQDRAPEEHCCPCTIIETRNGSYSTGKGRALDREKVEEWKTKFYAFEGFNTTNGWPTRRTLEDMGLKKVADVMKSKDKLG